MTSRRAHAAASAQPPFGPAVCSRRRASRPAARGGGPPRARRRRTGRGNRRRSRDRPAARRAGARARRAGSSARRRCGRRRTPRWAGRRPGRRRRVAQPREQLVAADRLDLLAEVLARRPFDLGQLRDGGVAQRQPERERLVAGERVADAGALARARDQPGRVQRLQVLRGVRRRLLARARELVDACAAPGRAGRAARAAAGWRTPCPSARSPRTARPFRVARPMIAIQ